jgi:hypothetical protein
MYIKIKYYKLPSVRQLSCHIDKGSDVTSSVPGNTSISYQHNTYKQPIKEIYICLDLINRESDKMCLVP